MLAPAKNKLLSVEVRKAMSWFTWKYPPGITPSTITSSITFLFDKTHSLDITRFFSFRSCAQTLSYIYLVRQKGNTNRQIRDRAACGRTKCVVLRLNSCGHETFLAITPTCHLLSVERLASITCFHINCCSIWIWYYINRVQTPRSLSYLRRWRVHPWDKRNLYAFYDN